jgi:putative ABC transport system ATP-binding protein
MWGLNIKLDSCSTPNDPAMGRETHLVDLSHVRKAFQTPAGQFTALKNIDLHVDQGEFVSIIGKSGSGKSTLINMITGIDRPTAGEVWVGGAALHDLNEGQTAVWRGRTIGIVFQFFQLLPALTAVENITLPMDFTHSLSLAARRERAMHLLDLVGMADVAGELPLALSGGQQQSVAIARALANDPPIIAADEPTGNLDSKSAEAVFQLFERLATEGKTILVVTHDNELAHRARRIIRLADGEIVNEAKPVHA